MSKLTVALEARLAALPTIVEVKDGYPASVSETGERYVIFNGVGVALEESVSTPPAFDSEAEAVAALEADIGLYASVRPPGTLYWRRRPETTQHGMKWSAYARLLISDKPVDEALVARMDAEAPSLSKARGRRAASPPPSSDAAEGLRLRLEKLSQVRGVEDGARSALAPTGEPYREFRGSARLESDALEALYDDVAIYAGGRAGVLYWRVRPETEQSGGLWRAYARLLISGSPVQPASGLYADEPSLKSAAEAVCIAVRCVRDGAGLKVRLPLPEVDRSTLRSHGVAADIWAVVGLPDAKKIEAIVLGAMRELTGHEINSPDDVVDRLEPVVAASRPPQFPYREPSPLTWMPPTWVLIITSATYARPPVVIGGYPSKAEAEAAGEAALGDPVRRDIFAWTRAHPRPEDAGKDIWNCEPAVPYRGPETEWHRYTVVPGAATSGPENYLGAAGGRLSEGSDGTHPRLAG